MKKKRVWIIVIVIILLLLIAGAGVALAYLNTDFLKTDKQLFFKYIGQVEDVTNILTDADLTTYFEKEKNTPYENEGKLSVNVQMPGYEEELKNTNNTNITFSGKVDKASDKIEQHFQLNYSNDVYFPFDYKHTEDLYALGSDIVANKYVAVRNENLQQLFLKLGLDTTTIASLPDKIETQTNSQTSDEDIKNSLNNYYNILETNLKDENFSKIDANTFELTLTQQEYKDILLKLLEELKNDTVLLKNDKTQVEELINEVQDMEATSEEKLKITVYKNEGKLYKIVIKVDDSTATIQLTDSKITIVSSTTNENGEEIAPIINIEKIKTGNDITYSITATADADQTTVQVYFTMKYAGIATQTAQETYTLGLTATTTDDTTQDLSEMQYEYVFNTAKTFSNDVNIEDLTTSTALILNDRDADYIQSTLAALGTKISQVNAAQMQQLGLSESQNPLIMATPIGIIYQIVGDVVDQSLQAQQNLQNASQAELNQLNSTLKALDEQIYSQYEGNSITGTEVKALLDQIVKTNKNETQIIKIVYNDQDLIPDEDIITNIKNVINATATYSVTYEHNTNTELVEIVTIKQN